MDTISLDKLVVAEIKKQCLASIKRVVYDHLSKRLDQMVEARMKVEPSLADRLDFISTKANTALSEARIAMQEMTKLNGLVNNDLGKSVAGQYAMVKEMQAVTRAITRLVVELRRENKAQKEATKPTPKRTTTKYSKP